MIIPPDQLSIDQYHGQAPAWLSKTSIRLYQQHGPRWWKLWLDGQVRAPVPDGVEQGLALDCLLTEGVDAFDARYPEIPADAPRRPDRRQIAAKNPSKETLAAIEWWQKWDEAHPGAVVLSDDDRAILFDAVDAVRDLPMWPQIQAALAQHTIRHRPDNAVFGLQARPDWMDLSAGIVWDLKKTRSLARFGTQAIDLGYHLQAALSGHLLAREGIALEAAYLVAVEWERGARARVYQIPDHVLDAGWRSLVATGEEIARRLTTNDWTDVQPEPQPLDVPEWMSRRMEQNS